MTTVVAVILLSLAWAGETPASDPGRGGVLSASLGIGLVGHEPLTFGGNARGYLNIGEHLCFGPEVVVLAPFEDEGERHAALEVSVVAHYIVPLTHPVALYPLLGVGADAVWVDGEGPGFIPRGRFGGGVHIDLHGWSPFLEYQLSAPGELEHTGVLGALLHLGRNP